MFYRSVCNLHFLVSLNACLGLQVGSSSLQVGSCWLTWANLSPRWAKWAPSWFKMGPSCPSWPPKKSVSQWGKNQLTPSWPQICTWRAQEPLQGGGICGCCVNKVGQKSMCFTYTSTHLTFIIENANSPNFYQRTGVLRMQKWPPRPSKMTQNRPQKQPQMTLKRFYQHTHFSLQPPRYAYADLRHEVCGAGIHACVFNI